jgi:alcohol dehydrogenase class IV
MFKIEHGFAVALTLAEVAAANSKVVDCEDLQAPFVPYLGLRAWLDRVCRNVQPLRLSAFDVKEAHIPNIVDAAFTAGRMDNNPVEFTKDDVKAMLLEVL